MHNGLLVGVLYGGQDALRKLLFGSDSDVSEHGARQLGEEALDEIEPETMLGGESKFEAALGSGESHLKLVDNVSGPCGFLENRF